MRVQGWHGLDGVPEDWGRSVVTIGVFDGVHRGHQRLVRRAAELAAEWDLPLVVVTFDPHPDEVTRPGTYQDRLSTPRHRVELLAELGADAVVVLPFTQEFSLLGPDEFVQQVLVDRLHAAAVAVGENFRFGRKASGDIDALRTLGEKYDFVAEAIPLVANMGGGLSGWDVGKARERGGKSAQVVNSTYIRGRVAAGDVEAAAAALGRPHRVEGVVVRGHMRGRALGFPTANVESPEHTAIPADGVYAGWLQCVTVGDIPAAYGGERWPAAISIGTNPQFDGEERTVEAYALDRDDLDLYGFHVAVDFAVRLRDTLRFDSLEEFIAQMRRDVDAARELTARGA